MNWTLLCVNMPLNLYVQWTLKDAAPPPIPNAKMMLLTCNIANHFSISEMKWTSVLFRTTVTAFLVVLLLIVYKFVMFLISGETTRLWLQFGKQCDLWLHFTIIASNSCFRWSCNCFMIKFLLPSNDPIILCVWVWVKMSLSLWHKSATTEWASKRKKKSCIQRHIPWVPGRCHLVVSGGFASSLPVLGEILVKIQGPAELLSKHLESIHSQSGSRGWEEGGAWEKERNKRVRGRQWERNTRESATFFLLKLIKYGPGLLKTQGLPGYWVCPGLGRLCSLLHCTLHCPAKAPHMVLTHKHIRAVMLALQFSSVIHKNVHMNGRRADKKRQVLTQKCVFTSRFYCCTLPRWWSCFHIQCWEFNFSLTLRAHCGLTHHRCDVETWSLDFNFVQCQWTVACWMNNINLWPYYRAQDILVRECLPW